MKKHTFPVKILFFVSVSLAYFGVAPAAACYYTQGSCGSGFDQMPSTFQNNGNAHNICCKGGGSAGVDDTPAAFDFPASPSLATTAGHTWTAIEMTGFDSATVSIATTLGAGTGEYRVCADSACTSVIKGWRTTSTGIAPGNYLQIRIGAAPKIRSDGSKITVNVGGVSDIAQITSATGSPYFIAFVTSSTWDGSIGGMSGAESKCQAAAAAAGLYGTFRTWISTSGSNTPANRFENAGTAAKFVMPNGTGNGVKLVDSWADLTDGTIDANFNYTENGTSVGASGVWTSVTSGGGSDSGNCSNWTSGAWADGGDYGRTDVTSSTWTENDAGGNGCNSSRRLFCFQTVLPN